MECHACGAELDPRDKFCSKCGAITERGKGASELAGRYLAELADGFGKLFAAALGYVANPENRKRVSIGGGLALVLLISLTSNPISRGVGGIFAAPIPEPSFNADGTPNFSDFRTIYLSEPSDYYVTGSANIRNYPTGQGSVVIGTLRQGQIVSGREVRAFDPDSQWLQLADGGYVWGSNLSVITEDEYDTGSTESDALGSHDFFGSWRTTGNCNSESGDTLTITLDGASYGPSFYMVDDTYYEGAVRYVRPQTVGQPEDSFFLSKVAGEPGIWMGVTRDHTSKEYFFFDAEAPCAVVNSFDPYP